MLPPHPCVPYEHILQWPSHHKTLMAKGGGLLTALVKLRELLRPFRLVVERGRVQVMQHGEELQQVVLRETDGGTKVRPSWHMTCDNNHNVDIGAPEKAAVCENVYGGVVQRKVQTKAINHWDATLVIKGN